MIKGVVFDKLTIGTVADHGDRLAVSARVARGGNVQTYLGSEFGIADRQTIRVYRPDTEVFDQDSMATFAHKVVTLTHPKSGKAVFDYDAVGWIGDEVARDGEFIRVPMVIAHSKAVDAIRKGTRELSVGYQMELDMTSGTSPKGEAYDAVMSKIVVDHVAIVGQARGGSELRIGDGEPKMKAILIDGMPVNVDDTVAPFVERHIATLTKTAADAQAALATATATHDKTMAAKDAEIDALKAKAVDAAQLDKLVADRAALVAKVGKLGSKVTADGKTNAEIRRAVLAEKGIAVDGKSDDYVEARFDALGDGAQARDGMSDALRTMPAGAGDAASAADVAHAKNIEDLNAWRYKA